MNFVGRLAAVVLVSILLAGSSFWWIYCLTDTRIERVAIQRKLHQARLENYLITRVAASVNQLAAFLEQVNGEVDVETTIQEDQFIANYKITAPISLIHQRAKKDLALFMAAQRLWIVHKKYALMRARLSLLPLPGIKNYQERVKAPYEK